MFCLPTEPIVRSSRPPSAHSVHSFLHQYTGSFKKPPLRRPQSVMGGGLGSLMAMPRNGSRLGETLFAFKLIPVIEDPGKDNERVFFMKHLEACASSRIAAAATIHLFFT